MVIDNFFEELKAAIAVFPMFAVNAYDYRFLAADHIHLVTMGLPLEPQVVVHSVAIVFEGIMRDFFEFLPT